jgi:hypothetical protein
MLYVKLECGVPPTEESRRALREAARRFVASLRATPGLAIFVQSERDGELRLSFWFQEPKRAYEFAAAMSAMLDTEIVPA